MRRNLIMQNGNLNMSLKTKIAMWGAAIIVYLLSIVALFFYLVYRYYL